MDKSRTSPKTAPLPPQNAAPDAPAEAPPRRPTDIPGLGPIRLRALNKAGFSTLSALRSASLDALQAVPGMSEVKARYLQDYLARFPALPDPEPENSVATTTDTVPVEENWVPVSDSAQSVQTAGAHALGCIVVLMAAHNEEALRPRLLRELVHLAERAEATVLGAIHLSDKDGERAERRLRQAGQLLSEAAAVRDLDRKAQARLADDLADLTDKLT